MAADEVRRLSIADVLVDTGAMSLCLPIDIVQRLGLPKLRDVMVTTATGDHARALYANAPLQIAGRSALSPSDARPVGSLPLRPV
jgi:predicted aspartyl protease